MIISDEYVRLDVFIADECYCELTLSEVAELFENNMNNIDLKPRQMSSIPDTFVYFSEDIDNNKFACKIYKTKYGSDRWLMFMKDNFEGYAMYKNPVSNRYELSWYHDKLEEPLSESQEKNMITCYVPNYK